MDIPGMLIDGRLVHGSERLAVHNPATGERLADAPRAGTAELEAALEAAVRAGPAWRALGWDSRRERVLAMADAVEANADELARLLTLEQGKPLAESTAEVGGLVHFFRQIARLESPDRLLREDPHRTVRLVHRPHGVVAAIVPWNFPLMILGFKLPPALLAGNTVVLKPAPTTPLSTLRFGELVQPLLPPGVLNIIVDANDLGGALTSDPRVAKISFTGSTATGRKVMQSAASSIKRLTLELGGNDPAILLDDVDVEALAPALFGNAFLNAGQVCVAVKRVYVPTHLHQRLADALAALADRAVVGDGLEQGVTMGPLQNAAQKEKVLAMLGEAERAGARVHRGRAPDGPGNFLPPAIVAEATDALTLVAEEQFGPALPIVSYTDEAALVAALNRSPYGLGASIWSADGDRAERLAGELDAGTVWINGHMDLDPAIPFAGARQSGLGTEFAETGLMEFLAPKVINRH